MSRRSCHWAAFPAIFLATAITLGVKKATSGGIDVGIVGNSSKGARLASVFNLWQKIGERGDLSAGVCGASGADARL
jgi:hypothetical protein